MIQQHIDLEVEDSERSAPLEPAAPDAKRQYIETELASRSFDDESDPMPMLSALQTHVSIRVREIMDYWMIANARDTSSGTVNGASHTVSIASAPVTDVSLPVTPDETGEACDCSASSHRHPRRECNWLIRLPSAAETGEQPQDKNGLEWQYHLDGDAKHTRRAIDPR